MLPVNDLRRDEKRVEHVIRIGAPGGGFTPAVGGETYRGVRPDTLIQGAACAKKAGRYPTSICA